VSVSSLAVSVLFLFFSFCSFYFTRGTTEIDLITCTSEILPVSSTPNDEVEEKEEEGERDGERKTM
jgi:hypothetical protein